MIIPLSLRLNRVYYAVVSTGVCLYPVGKY